MVQCLVEAGEGLGEPLQLVRQAFEVFQIFRHRMLPVMSLAPGWVRKSVFTGNPIALGRWAYICVVLLSTNQGGRLK